MASLWQRIKTSSEGLQSFNLVTNIFNSRKYQDLESDVAANGTDSDVGGVGEVDTQFATSPDSPSESGDGLDAGVCRRRYKILHLIDDINVEKNAEKDPDSLDDALWRENNRNELIETQDKLNQLEQQDKISSPTDANELVSNQTESVNADVISDDFKQMDIIGVNYSPVLKQGPTNTRNQGENEQVSEISCQSVSLSDTSEKATLPVSSMETVESYRHEPYRRVRRNSYEIALAEMRDSYDKTFGDDLFRSVDKPVESLNGTTSPAWTAINSHESTKPQDTVGKKTSFRRQLSSVLSDKMPAPVNGFRQKSYSKLTNNSDEIVDISLNDDNQPIEWHETFPAPQKKKRKRPKKAWKRTKKAARVTLKWIRRSFIAFGSSFNYGVPINVAMYGGSRRDGRPKFYDYR